MEIGWLVEGKLSGVQAMVVGQDIDRRQYDIEVNTSTVLGDRDRVGVVAGGAGLGVVAGGAGWLHLPSRHMSATICRSMG